MKHKSCDIMQINPDTIRVDQELTGINCLNRIGNGRFRFRRFMKMVANDKESENKPDSAPYRITAHSQFPIDQRVSDYGVSKTHFSNTLEIVAKLEQLHGLLVSMQSIEKQILLSFHIPVIGLIRIKAEYRKPSVKFGIWIDPVSGYWNDQTKTDLLNNLRCRLNVPFECVFRESFSGTAGSSEASVMTE